MNRLREPPSTLFVGLATVLIPMSQRSAANVRQAKMFAPAGVRFGDLNQTDFDHLWQDPIPLLHERKFLISSRSSVISESRQKAVQRQPMTVRNFVRLFG